MSLTKAQQKMYKKAKEAKNAPKQAISAESKVRSNPHALFYISYEGENRKRQGCFHLQGSSHFVVCVACDARSVGL
jgi:hypothetical protein